MLPRRGCSRGIAVWMSASIVREVDVLFALRMVLVRIMIVADLFDVCPVVTVGLAGQMDVACSQVVGFFVMLRQLLRVRPRRDHGCCSSNLSCL